MGNQKLVTGWNITRNSDKIGEKCCRRGNLVCLSKIACMLVSTMRNKGTWRKGEGTLTFFLHVVDQFVIVILPSWLIWLNTLPKIKLKLKHSIGDFSRPINNIESYPLQTYTAGLLQTVINFQCDIYVISLAEMF